MFIYTVLCIKNTVHSILEAPNDPIILIYPDVTVRNVSLNFTVNADEGG